VDSRKSQSQRQRGKREEWDYQKEKGNGTQDEVNGRSGLRNVIKTKDIQRKGI